MSYGPNVDPEILMSDTVSFSSLRCNWLPVLTPVWDSAAEPMLVHAGQPIVCGSSNGSDLQISLDGVDKRHCQLEFRGGVLTVLQTWAAVWVNDVPVNAGATIVPGDRVAIGAATFRVGKMIEESEKTDFPSMPLRLHTATFAGSANRDHSNPQAERLQEWHHDLQKRNDDLTQQAKHLDDRFHHLRKSQAEYEQLSHGLEESYSAVRAEWMSAENNRAQLQVEQSRVQRLTNELELSQQTHNQWESELRIRSQELQSWSESLAARSEDLKNQAHLLKSKHVEFEEQRLAQEAASEQVRQQIVSEEAALVGQQQQLQAKIKESQSALAAVQQRRQEQEAEWAQRQAEIEGQELAAKALAQQQTLLDEQNNSLVSREFAADEREQELILLAESCDAKKQKLAQRSLGLEAEQQEFEQRAAAFSAQEQEFQSQLSICESELKSQQEALTVELEKLQEWEAELRDRHEETAERVSAFKRARAEKRLQVLAEGESSNARIQELSGLLTEANVRLQASADSTLELEGRTSDLQSERDALTQSLQELQEHVDLLESQLVEQVDTDMHPQHEKRVAELTNELAGHEIKREHSGKELDDLFLQLLALGSTVGSQDGQEEELLRQVDAVRAEIRVANESVGNDRDMILAQSSEQQLLLQELTEQFQVYEQAMNQLQVTEAECNVQASEVVQQLAERDAVIEELRERLELEEATSAAYVSKNQEQDESGWQQELEERDGLIRELQEQLVMSQCVVDAESSGVSYKEVRMRSRELDDRTLVLDRRDDELGEWNRRLQNTEEELEAGYRQLQDSRQQLELARAEIQVSMEYATPDREVEVQAEYAKAVGPAVPEKNVTDLRSELASLFGIEVDSKSEVPVEELMDVGTEGGDAIVLSFEETQSVLVEAQQENSASEEAEGHDSDHATRYMEQLLERSRTSAGESLPEELNQIETPAAQRTKRISSIDHYSQTHPDESSETGDEVASVRGYNAAWLDAPPLARQESDLRALRQDMDSFRQVSARSLQKALESYAIRKDRNGMAGRQAVTGVLALMTVFAAAANVMGLIAFPKLVWGLTAASAIAAVELFRRRYMVKLHLRELTDHVGPAPDTTIAPVEQPDVAVEGEEPVGEYVIGPIAENETRTAAVVSATIIPEELPAPEEEVAPEAVKANVLTATEEEKQYEP